MRFIVAFLLCFNFASHAAEPLPVPIQHALQRARLPTSALALVIAPLDSSRPPILYNADQPMNPASVMKLVTTYAALDLLGPVYQWPTELRSAATPANGLLAGDLYLKGYGDPKLTLERVWLMLRDLRAQDVREIRGDLVLDRSFFVLGPDNAVFDDDGNTPERPFLVGPDALLLNFKSVRLRIAANASGIATMLDPALPEIQIDNRLQVAPATDCALWKNKLALKVEDGGNAARILLNGSIPAGCQGERYLAALDHPVYSASLIRTLWHEMGGVWSGGVREGVVPENTPVLVSSLSPELPTYLRDINKYSNNLMARQVFLTLGAVTGATEEGSDTAQRASAVIRHWLQNKGWRFDELVMENGAGLSRQSRISARHLAQLLADAGHSALAAEFVSSLPLVALDGTMKKRLLGELLDGKAHIKTGSLKDVRSVAGYVQDATGNTQIVVAIINHPRATEGIPVLDEVLRFAFDKTVSPAVLALPTVAR
ncbi:MAG: D-alanyl-D-alanine carboxypeptidase/D-alanyl-D-alanine-endopeptidase [Formivibrio sp.]|nr:D-alanyl-D-alanine carboxypeptidase/D-alanyl-D-alanine-endopeptidase [Formivibrio sp.]